MSLKPGNQRATRVDRIDMPAARRSSRAIAPGRRALGPLVIIALAVAAACGSGSSDELSEAGERGRRIATSKGCASCHGVDGQGGVGPKWTGLVGSEVTLADGRVVVADDAYLRTAIVDPSSELVAGFAVQMPDNELTDDEVADVIAYIHDLSVDGGADGG